MSQTLGFAKGVSVFQRGWLSSNNVLIQGAHSCALVDSGYYTHADQTVALVASTLKDRPLDLLLSTHLHSDHCGGNAALQAKYPEVQTHIPPGHAGYVREWDAHALSYTPTGQHCPPFRLDGVLQPGSEMLLGDQHWQVHAAPGHDPHSVILFEPLSRTLLSADALWERGFGVVFPELDGNDAFDEVAATLDLIESLQPHVVVPGHGAPFTAVDAALAYARKRLDGFMQSPQRHLQYAAKVLLKFKLLELQQIAQDDLVRWANRTAYLHTLIAKINHNRSFDDAVLELVQELVQSGAARTDRHMILNA